VNLRPIHRLLVFAAALVIASCSSSGYVAQTPSMPAAREALRPEYRLFYDALQDYGDWVLIEPVGFVFHPRVDFASFRPYQDGFWAPSDPYGWVWISAEPFGWATYHYGYWFYDRFQGWVWTPGMDWGPAWVTWEVAGNYAGWAALPPAGRSVGDVPGGAYVFAPLNKLGATDLHDQMVRADGLGAPVVQSARPVENVIEKDGVRFNAGPSFAMVERARGAPLQRVKVEEAPGSPAPRKDTTPAPASPAGATQPATQVQATRAAATAAAREARGWMEQGGLAPARVQVVHAPAPKPADETPPAPKPAHQKTPKGAPSDSTG
jgi:hypothetical protein